VLGAAADVVDDLRADGVPVGTLGVTCFRPWPLDEIRAALAGVSRVIVLNRAFSVGSGSILGADVRLSLAAEQTRVYDVVLGLGGRPVTRAVLRRLLDDVLDGQVSDHALSFPDLDVDTVVRELDRGGPDRPEAVTRGELGAHEWGKAWT
jgi:pyruvate ferredoxin oxidoreductase alpha subunit